MRNSLFGLFKEPLIQFLLIGACIYGAYALFGAPEEDFRDTRVHVDARRINSFISEWESRWNRPPTRDEINGLIQSYIKEDVLYRQAVSMGLNEDDPITRRRMAQKLEFLTSDLASMVEPAEGELERYFNESSELYQKPDLISFYQVFFNPDIREASTLDDAAEVLAQLQKQGEPGPESLLVSDRFMVPNEFVAVTELGVSRQLGKDFAQSVMNLEEGSWHGPIVSGYGVHLVYVFDFEASPPAVFAEVRDAVFENWQLERRTDFNAEFLENLKSRYEIVIDEIPADWIIENRTDAELTGVPAT